MNVFYLQNADGQAFGRLSSHPLEALRYIVLDILNEKPVNFSNTNKRVSKRAAAIPVKPRIKILDTSNPGVHIVEIEGRDRVGLLSDLAQTFRDAELSVLSAHIEVVGAMAVDAFYVRPAFGNEFGKSARKALRQKLKTVLEPEGSAAAA